MLDKKSIKSKLKIISQYLEELEANLKYSNNEIKKDLNRLRAVERIFQLIVDMMVGINLHIIARKNFKSPDDYQGTFEILGNNDVLPDIFAFRIAPAVGLRNNIVHKYDKVDINLFIRILRKERDDFKKYLVLIEKYIKKEK